MAQHNYLGKEGENIAENYLINNGYAIVDRNWRCPEGEIDLIVCKNRFVVFVEVKTRSSTYWGNPEEAISSHRIKRMVEAADYYIQDNNLDCDIRFDIIAIILNENTTKVDHIADAFVAPLY